MGQRAGEGHIARARARSTSGTREVWTKHHAGAGAGAATRAFGRSMNGALVIIYASFILYSTTVLVHVLLFMQKVTKKFTWTIKWYTGED